MDKIINGFSWFAALNMLVLVMAPLLEAKIRLPFPTWMPFDIYKSKILFWMIYGYQAGVATFAGGSNIAVNMYIFIVLDIINFILELFNTRVAVLGYANDMKKHSANTVPHSRVSYYEDTVECIELHLQIEKYDAFT